MKLCSLIGTSIAASAVFASQAAAQDRQRTEAVQRTLDPVETEGVTRHRGHSTTARGNLLDTEYIAFSSNGGGVVFADPRTFGVDFGVRF